MPSPSRRRGTSIPSSGGRVRSEARAMALLPEMPLGEHVVEDYASLSLTLKRHPLAFLRAELAARGSGHRRRTRPSAGRPAARDRRDRADPAAPGQRQRRRLHHHRGRDRDRQSDRLARHPRTLPPRRARRDPAAAAPANCSARRASSMSSPRISRLDPAAQHIAREDRARPHRRRPAADRNRPSRCANGCPATIRATSSSPAAISDSLQPPLLPAKL